MKKFAFILVCMAILEANHQCMAQNDSQAITDWGKSVQGVRLGIAMATNVFQIGSSATVLSVTKNSSTEAIKVDISMPTINFDVILTSSTGKSYHITTPTAAAYPSIFKTINFGEKTDESIPVTFGKTRFGDMVEPGEYTLKATRKFSSNDGSFTLESNSIKVTIVK